MARASAAYGGRDWSYFLPVTRWAEAVLAWHAGRAAECVAILRPAAARLLEMQARTWAALALFDLAEAAADAGDVAAATAAAEDLAAVAEFVALPLVPRLRRGGVGLGGPGRRRRRASGRVRAAGDRAAVDDRLRGPPGPRPSRPRAIAAGRTQRAEAVAALERAAAIFERCGSSWRRRRSLDALRRLGSAGRRAAAAALGPGSLTRREREVARLAATGMSAKEIAGTLFVGERTVESHLASVYAKLGVESKLQLVRRAAELGLS